MSAREREREEDIRAAVEAIGAATRDAGADQAPWTLAELVANGVLAVCNLAETIDARGAGIRDAVSETLLGDD